MNNIIVLNFKDGNFNKGFTVNLLFGDKTESEISAFLPRSLQIFQSFKEWWESSDHKRSSRGISAKSGIKTKTEEDQEDEQKKQEIRAKATNLQDRLNQWLNSESFASIHQKLTEILHANPEVQLFIQTDNQQLQQLPWHSWNILNLYPKIEVSLSFPTPYLSRKRSWLNLRNKIRILAILGDRSRIDISPDWQALKALPPEQAEIVFLGLDENKPNQSTLTRQEIYEKLWDEKGWDILFFAGHSNTDWNQDGRISINSEDSLTIPELRSALRSAIALGLRLAIFNSCDGLGLAQGLADLQIPQVIVMRKPIPDPVAHKFLENFLVHFAHNQESLYTSVKLARKSLEDLENDYPYASWLPIICQNPIDPGLNWQDLLNNLNVTPTWESCCCAMLVLDALKRLKVNMFVQGTSPLPANTEVEMDAEIESENRSY